MPLPIIRTGRLALHPWTAEDLDILHSFWTVPEVRRVLWDDTVITREVSERVLNSHLATQARDGIGFWIIFVSDSHFSTVPGFCGFRYIDDGSDIELLYGLRGEHWGKGFATEASHAIIEYLWVSTGFTRLYARADPPNERSVRVMQRLGMLQEVTGGPVVTYVLPRPTGLAIPAKVA
jgi:ribosomal-protein-alanine N-acetyltransferase